MDLGKWEGKTHVQTGPKSIDITELEREPLAYNKTVGGLREYN